MSCAAPETGRPMRAKENFKSPLLSTTVYGIITTETKRNPDMKDNIMRSTPVFKALRAKAREAIAAYADGADFDLTVARLAEIGESMSILLA